MKEEKVRERGVWLWRRWSPDARIIQTTVGIHFPIGWTWYQPSPSRDDQRGTGAKLEGFGVGFAYRDTNPTVFGTTRLD